MTPACWKASHLFSKYSDFFSYHYLCQHWLLSAGQAKFIGRHDVDTRESSFFKQQMSKGNGGILIPGAIQEPFPTGESWWSRIRSCPHHDTVLQLRGTQAFCVATISVKSADHLFAVDCRQEHGLFKCYAWVLPSSNVRNIVTVVNLAAILWNVCSLTMASSHVILFMFCAFIWKLF